jgi:LPS-assembly lipoprotein
MPWVGAAGLLLLVLGLTGCGFQLRGQAQLPSAMRITYIKVNRPADTPPSNLERILTDLLTTNGVQVTTDAKQATATLEILNEEKNSRLIGASNQGLSRLYNLSYQVKYHVVLPDGKTLLPDSSASATRDILYPESAVLNKAQGEQAAQKDMEYEVARAILYRLEALGRT